jgi:RimJ/RimL family protein N-acetyltransferase
VSAEPAAGVVARSLRVVIRERTLADAPDEFQWRRDPETATLNATRPVSVTYAEFLDAFERDLRLHDPTRRAFAIDTADGAHIGSVMYYNGNHSVGTVEFGIGIYIDEHRGAGMGTEATIIFLRWAWQNLPFRRIYLHTLEWNDRAHKCFLRAGFEDKGRVFRLQQSFVRMEAQREWWLLWDSEGRFQPPIRHTDAEDASEW